LKIASVTRHSAAQRTWQRRDRAVIQVGPLVTWPRGIVAN
jgi:hypothetical protein